MVQINMMQQPLRHGALGVHPVSAGSLSWRYVESFFGCERAFDLSQALCDRNGFRPATISHAAFWRMCMDNVVQYGDEAHGIAWRVLPRSSWGMVYSAVNQMDSLGEGLKRFVHLVSILDVGIRASLSYSARGVHLRYEMNGHSGDAARADQYLESLAMFFHCMLVSLTNRLFEPVEVRLSERLHAQDGSLLARLRCSQTRRGTGLSLIYDHQAMAIPLGVRKYRCWCSADSEAFFRILGGFEERATDDSHVIVVNVADMLRKLLAARSVSQDQAAAMLNMSTATMRRRLANEGTSFREISREIRTQRLTFLLNSGQKLDDIADKLGLSDRRSLSRACNQWLGMSPTHFQMARSEAIAAE